MWWKNLRKLNKMFDKVKLIREVMKVEKEGVGMRSMEIEMEFLRE